MWQFCLFMENRYQAWIASNCKFALVCLADQLKNQLPKAEFRPDCPLTANESYGSACFSADWRAQIHFTISENTDSEPLDHAFRNCCYLILNHCSTAEKELSPETWLSGVYWFLLLCSALTLACFPWQHFHRVAPPARPMPV